YGLKREFWDTKEAVLVLNVQVEKGVKLLETGVDLFRYFLEQNSVDKLASEVKLEDSFDAVLVRSKSSKSFRTSAKRANRKSAKGKTKGTRNTGDHVMKEE
ncbi:hypothetical protein OCU04_003130, partial [Sclerotinia nivalis]